jgi:hypothetical protein
VVQSRQPQNGGMWKASALSTNIGSVSPPYISCTLGVEFFTTVSRVDERYEVQAARTPVAGTGPNIGVHDAATRLSSIAQVLAPPRGTR